jgi:hypothetical protein
MGVHVRLPHRAGSRTHCQALFRRYFEASASTDEQAHSFRAVPRVLQLIVRALRWLGVSRWLALLGAAVWLGAGCARCDNPGRVTPPAKLCVREAPGEACRAVSEVESVLRSPGLEILGSEETPAGRQGARILTLRAPGEVRFRAKWRALSSSHGLNDPRKELAAYAVQKLFLAPDDFVVPPVVGHCFPLDNYWARVDKNDAQSFANVRCVYGLLSYWLENARSVRDAHSEGWLPSNQLFDASLFARNETYARTLADTNLLLHLIRHGDSHRDQFVLTGSAAQPHVYCVDHTIAFSNYRNPTLAPKDEWSQIHVPRLSRRSVSALTALRREELDSLSVVEQYENRDGVLVATPVAPVAGHREAGMRWAENQLQVGLTNVEIDELWRQIDEVRANVARGSIATE